MLRVHTACELALPTAWTGRASPAPSAASSVSQGVSKDAGVCRLLPGAGLGSDTLTWASSQLSEPLRRADRASWGEQCQPGETGESALPLSLAPPTGGGNLEDSLQESRSPKA